MDGRTTEASFIQVHKMPVVSSSWYPYHVTYWLPLPGQLLLYWVYKFLFFLYTSTNLITLNLTNFFCSWICNWGQTWQGKFLFTWSLGHLLREWLGVAADGSYPAYLSPHAGSGCLQVFSLYMLFPAWWPQSDWPSYMAIGFPRVSAPSFLSPPPQSFRKP